jgi:hypothetical protein
MLPFAQSKRSHTSEFAVRIHFLRVEYVGSISDANDDSKGSLVGATVVKTPSQIHHHSITTLRPLGGGRYSIVAEGVDVIPPWEFSTAYRGVLRKTGHRTFSFAQIRFSGPSQFTDPGEGVPDIVGIRGEMTMLDCDHSEVEFGPAGFYAWGQIPFEDAPLATSPPAIAYFTRVPFDSVPQSQAR